MGQTKLVLIGAGSTSFGVSTVADLFQQREQFPGSTLVLCDVNETKLHRVKRLAERMNAATGMPFVIQAVTDYRRALEGAGFVLVSIEVDRLERWKLDWQIPFQYGVQHVLGEMAVNPWAITWLRSCWQHRDGLAEVRDASIFAVFANARRRKAAPAR